MWFYIPGYVATIIHCIGVLTVATFVSKALFLAKYRLLNQSWPKNITEFKIFQLNEEKQRLLKKIEHLESENSKILDSIIHHLKEKP